jgi:CDP-diacylglycerol--serine O-phosphatidyltransferase
VKDHVSPPNLITSGNLLAGFLALVVVAQGHPGWAAVLVLAAGICDSLDGLVARHTDSECAFGSRLDSLADLVSFGAAPALVLYAGALDAVPVGGIGACLAFVLGGAWRLARFSLVENRHYFVGLPIPAAGVIAVILGVSPAPPLALCLIAAVLAGMMASTVPFPTLATLFRSLRRSSTRDVQVTASGDAAEQGPPAGE